MTAKALRALLPVLKDLREAGIARFSTGEGESRVAFEFARPEPPSVNQALPSAEDTTGAEDEAEHNPLFYLEKFAREGGYERSRGT